MEQTRKVSLAVIGHLGSSPFLEPIAISREMCSNFQGNMIGQE